MSISVEFQGDVDRLPHKDLAEKILHSINEAVKEASEVLPISGTQTAMWNGHVVDGTSVLVKYSYAGDLDLAPPHRALVRRPAGRERAVVGPMSWLDALGWAGSALLVWSLLQARILRLRAINLGWHTDQIDSRGRLAFQVEFFDLPEMFWVVVGLMIAMAAATLVVARWRGWL